MSLTDYEDFVYGAGKLGEADPVAAWRRVERDQQRIADLLNAKRVIRLVSPDTDLTCVTAGRAWINACGTRNFPDGEVFTSPDETKTEGHVRITYPAVYQGREVVDVRLTFRERRVVEATAAKGQDYLETLLNSDEGTRRRGEAAFGLNYDIARFTRNILFDLGVSAYEFGRDVEADPSQFSGTDARTFGLHGYLPTMTRPRWQTRE